MGSARVLGRVAAVQRHQRPGDPAGGVGGEKDGQALDVVRFAQAADGDPAQVGVAQLGVGVDAPAQAVVHDLGAYDGVDAHALAAPLGAHLPGHLGHAAHGDAVGHVAAAEGRQPGDGHDVEDAAPSGLDHAPGAFLAADVPSDDQGVQSLNEPGFGDFQRELVDTALPGDVGQYVDPAVGLVQRREHRADLRAIGYVAHDRFGAAAQALDLPGRVLHALFVDIGQHEIRAGLGEPDGRRPAHAGGCAGDQGHFPAQVE